MQYIWGSRILSQFAESFHFFKATQSLVESPLPPPEGCLKLHHVICLIINQSLCGRDWLAPGHPLSYWQGWDLNLRLLSQPDALPLILTYFHCFLGVLTLLLPPLQDTGCPEREPWRSFPGSDQKTPLHHWRRLLEACAGVGAGPCQPSSLSWEAALRRARRAFVCSQSDGAEINGAPLTLHPASTSQGRHTDVEC